VECPSRPSEYSVELLAAGRSRRHGVRSEFAARSEFLVLRSIARIGLSDPTMPLAVSSAAWFFFAGLHRSQLSDRCALSASSAFLQRLAQHDLACRPQPTSTSHGLRFPSALTGSEVH
jgi:hypothetical protein